MPDPFDYNTPDPTRALRRKLRFWRWWALIVTLLLVAMVWWFGTSAPWGIGNRSFTISGIRTGRDEHRGGDERLADAGAGQGRIRRPP